MKRFMTTKMAMSVLVIAVALVMVGVGTFASWSDTEDSTGNSFTAGSLDLQLSNDNATWTDGTSSSFVVGNVAPGTPLTNDGVLYIKNAGTVLGSTVAVSVKNLVETDSGCVEPERVAEGGACDGNGELGQYVYITVKDSGGNILINDKQLSSLPSGSSAAVGLGAAATDWLQVSYRVASAAGNNTMTDKATYDVQVDLTQ